MMLTDFSIDAILSAKPSSSSSSSSNSESSSTTDAVCVHLQANNLWRRFHCLGTEMIVTKSGRRMFPTLSVIITGLDPLKSYIVMVDLECVDKKRFRYSFHQSKWVATGPGDSELPSRMFVHSDSPASGAHWMRASINFDKLKLTNNQMDNNGHIIVNSMHKYRPRIHIIDQNNQENRSIFSFDETEFIAVTAYQNHRITSLKIESNPFAKGFRECEIQNELDIINFSATSTTTTPSVAAAAVAASTNLHFQTVFPIVFPFLNYQKS